MVDELDRMGGVTLGDVHDGNAKDLEASSGCFQRVKIFKV